MYDHFYDSNAIMLASMAISQLNSHIDQYESFLEATRLY
jgi:hypothetical protein